MVSRKEVGSQASSDTIFLTVSMVLNPKQGVKVIILEGFPEIYLVKFKLSGSLMTRSRRFRVDVVYPVDGYPLLNPREEGQLVQALNAAALTQVDIPVTLINRSMIQSDDVQELPRRKLRLATPGAA